MTSLELIKAKMKQLYQTNPNIHITASIATPKTELKDELVKLKGVYPHIFQIEETTTGSARCHTLQYTEILTEHIEISELE